MSRTQEKLQKAATLHRAGEFASAGELYRQVLKTQPRNFDALQLSGLIALAKGDREGAIRLFGKAIDGNPRHPALSSASLNLGAAYKELGRLDQALQCLERALALNPAYADAWCNRGVVLKDLGRHDQALDSYDKALALRPDYAVAHYNRASLLKERLEFAQALAGYERSIALQPAHSASHSNCAAVLYELGRLPEALAACDRAIELSAHNADAHRNRANILKRLGRTDAAAAAYDAVVKLDPTLVGQSLNRAIVLLRQGDYERGWVEYEWRWKVPSAMAYQARNPFTMPLWLGDAPLAGKTIFLHCEQGLGDTLQFCRYAKPLAQLGARVVLGVQPSLKRLLATVAGVSLIVSRGDVIPPADYYCPLLSLPLAFKTTEATIPAQIPYIHSDPVKVRGWQEKLGPAMRPRVGIVWSGGFHPDQPELYGVNGRRNVPLSRLKILADPRFDYISLQKGEPAETELREALASGWEGPQLRNFVSELEDFSDTAALIELLDVVVAVDTATAHLAAALGKTVWLLNRFDTCWRWLLERDDSPWYPTVRQYRQQHAGDWDGVLRRVKADLEGLLGQQRP